MLKSLSRKFSVLSVCQIVIYSCCTNDTSNGLLYIFLWAWPTLINSNLQVGDYEEHMEVVDKESALVHETYEQPSYGECNDKS